MTESPNDRLRRAREHAGYKSAAAFAAAHDITESTYRSAENGTRGIGLGAAKKYAPLLGVTWQWLMEGGDEQLNFKGQPKSSQKLHRAGQEPLTSQELNIQQFPRDIPILGSGACGEDGLFELNGQIHGYAKRPPRLLGVRDAYAVYIQGESMVPWRKPGQLVYADPYQPPQIGDFVIVQLKPAG